MLLKGNVYFNTFIEFIQFFDLALLTTCIFILVKVVPLRPVWSHIYRAVAIGRGGHTSPYTPRDKVIIIMNAIQVNIFSHNCFIFVSKLVTKQMKLL